ncbi:MAG TPA: WecB/TagA/CpsF family glycosyltransferase [Bacteroidales bacterium]|nr:WecB/TagA/CpsF family glycosyltransferase [Bacteroidales bacterium]
MFWGRLFYAGTTKRPPKWLISIGLEWLGRLLMEPRRLWRRTFVSGPIFIYDVLRTKRS